jgi:predicted nucleic acid-binding protein
MSALQRVYLESTVWYQLANYSSSEFKDRARQLFDLVEQKTYAVYISTIVLEELALSQPKYRRRLEELLTRYRPSLIVQNVEADDIAAAYLENSYKAMDPASVVVDALHIALATTANISYVATYNYRYMLNVRILQHINAVNLLAGYNRFLGVLPPFMFVNLQDYGGEKGTVDRVVWDIKRVLGTRVLGRTQQAPAQRCAYYDSIAQDGAHRLGLPIVKLTDVLY